MTHREHRGRWQLPATILAVAGFALALGGLGSQAASGQGAQASKVPTVGIVEFAFRPATLRLTAGSSVTFSNRSKVVHTATRAGSFDTGTIAPGKSATVRFKRRGTFAYVCTVHPAMHGKIVVE